MIKGISEVRRIPRLGKLRLGIKKKTAQGKEYPSEVDYFVLDPETPDQKRRDALIAQFTELYGDKPKAIKIMFPPADPSLFFAQFYKRYGKGTLLKCKGDGEVAETTPEFGKDLEVIGETERGFIQVVCKGPECPYQASHECGRMASLQVILPELSGVGVWQINTGSYNSIVNINSAIEWIKGLCGRFAMIPLTLMRVPQEIAYEGKRSKHYILQIDQNISIGEIQKFASITSVERALIPAIDEKKDELFYDANGKNPELPALDDKTASPGAVGSTFGDQAGADVGAPEETDDTATGKLDKPQDNPVKSSGPLSKDFDAEVKSRATMKELMDGIKTNKTKLSVKEYCETLKEGGYIDKLLPAHKDELRAKTSAYMKELKA